METGRLDRIVPVAEYFDARLALDSYRGASQGAPQARADGGIGVVQVLAIVAVVVAVGAGALVARRVLR